MQTHNFPPPFPPYRPARPRSMQTCMSVKLQDLASAGLEFQIWVGVTQGWPVSDQIPPPFSIFTFSDRSGGVFHSTMVGSLQSIGRARRRESPCSSTGTVPPRPLPPRPSRDLSGANILPFSRFLFPFHFPPIIIIIIAETFLFLVPA